jgi:hypothetical protein
MAAVASSVPVGCSICSRKNTPTLLDCAKAGDYGAVVCAWGDNAKPARASQVLTRFAAAGVTPYCLGTTKRGAPKHPLRIAYSTPLQVLPVAAASAG